MRMGELLNEISLIPLRYLPFSLELIFTKSPPNSLSLLFLIVGSVVVRLYGQWNGLK